MTKRKSDFYVLAIFKNKELIGYGVYDQVGGMEVEHGRYIIGSNAVTADSCLWMANGQRDDMNAEIK